MCVCVSRTATRSSSPKAPPPTTPASPGPRRRPPFPLPHSDAGPRGRGKRQQWRRRRRRKRKGDRFYPSLKDVSSRQEERPSGGACVTGRPARPCRAAHQRREPPACRWPRAAAGRGGEREGRVASAPARVAAAVSARLAGACAVRRGGCLWCEARRRPTWRRRLARQRPSVSVYGRHHSYLFFFFFLWVRLYMEALTAF